MFTPTRPAALRRLADFTPRAGRDYATLRNHDDMAHVSALSPYIRHRIITEEEVLRAVLTQHSPQAAEKFVQEVFWRGYWKGWLEQRPALWADYRRDLGAALNAVQTQAGLRQRWQAACLGQTGIDGFDHWARQLVDTGYLHNHARMWFASIWIHTLDLPWVLGADFFLRHLLDGDPASNTLSWRWVGGIQTLGKAYLAQPDNIAKYTQGRFRPEGLAQVAATLPCPPHPDRGALPASGVIDPAKRSGLIITEEDLSPDWLLDQVTPVATAFVRTTAWRSPLQVAPMVTDFVAAAMRDCQDRYAGQLGQVSVISVDALPAWRRAAGLDQVVMAYPPVGPTADALRSVDALRMLRAYDLDAWPHATHGFFRFKDAIPKLLGRIKGLALL
ncbi:FAD-binding domain-containing protein [Yoonia vestfoldensis]|uniref:Deoxyribodipyrimidine photo-lyase n=1 Tax=Yoonia vestfoldensis TaxID=245188 RepID=A0A1Y0EA32_9RHOB|nr:FAD-binding domain-containing protein [Yoonia vestfoldensis]ARU00358.1 deoxyribodipyrimidine photo-lyase [Yoonia vestfoldensis]